MNNKSYNEAYYQRNKIEILAKQKGNRRAINARVRIWSRNNKDKMAAYKRKQRAKDSLLTYPHLYNMHDAVYNIILAKIAARNNILCRPWV